jgi:hypothetical protein
VQHLFDARPVLEALRTLKLSASSFHSPCDVVGWYKQKGYISRCSSVTVTDLPGGPRNGRVTFMTHFAVWMLLRLYHRPVGNGAEELARVRPLVDSISRFANDSGEDSGEDSEAEESDEAAEPDKDGEGEKRAENSTVAAAASTRSSRAGLAKLKLLVTISWNGIAIDVYRYKGQVSSSSHVAPDCFRC